MIEATIYNRDESELCRAWFRATPHVGDKLWIADGERRATEAVRITEVQHQTDRAWRPPMLGGGDPPHSLILYVVTV